MKFRIESGQLLAAVQAANSVVERRQTLPILANVLLFITTGQLIITATDLDVEITLSVPVIDHDGEVKTTLPARKLLDVCRVSDPKTVLEFNIEEESATIKSGKTRFSLLPMPAVEFPMIETGSGGLVFSISQRDFKKALENTAFAMAQQDVRYYLNGMLFEVEHNRLGLIATDGHRMAVANIEIADQAETTAQIVPRKSVIELIRLLSSDVDEMVEVRLSDGYLTVMVGRTLFKSKLIVATFPDYQQVIPRNLDKTVTVERELLKDSLTRVAIFSNEKLRLVRLVLDEGLLYLQTSNSEKEIAEDEITLDYQGPKLEIGFNVSYLLDIVTAINSREVVFHLKDVGTGCLIEPSVGKGRQYVIMPMRL